MRPRSNPHATAPGVKLGQVIAQTVAKAMIGARHATHQLDIDARVKAQELFHERYEPTLVEACRGLLERMTGHPAVHDVVQPVIRDMLAKRGQIQGQMLGFALPFLIGEGLSPVLQPFAQGLQNEAWGKLLGSAVQFLGVPLAPAQLADLVVKGYLTEPDAAELAKISGTPPDDFHLMVLDTGEAPSPQELLFAYRRGIIDRTRLEHGIRQGHLRNEWIDVVEALRFQPMTPANAVAAAVQGHLSQAQAQQKWAEGGLDPGDFQAAYETAGRPPGPSELMELLNRQIITEPEFVAAVRESDVKDKYIPLLLRLRQYLPPPRTVTALLREGAISHQAALAYLADYGVQTADAEAYLKGATSQKVAKQKDLAITTVEALYHDHVMTRADASHAIESLGYTAHDADFILTVQDLKREQAYAERAISAVHSQYVAHRLTETQAREVLTELHVDRPQQDHLLVLWTHEAQARVRTLTPAQVIAAVKYQLMTDQEALVELKAMGYSDRNAKLVIDIGAKSEVFPVPPNH